MKTIAFSLVCILITTSAITQVSDNPAVDWRKIKVLIYTRNGKGYVHDNIPFAVKCFQNMSKQYGFAAEASENPEVFTEENLKQYSVVIFPSTNNDVFDTDQQRLAFRHFIEAGGGFVGVHSVVGTERNWPWFKMMLGGTFAWHPKFQKYRLQVIDALHSSMTGIPKSWEKEDECYFMKELYPGIRPVLAHDLTSLNPEESEKIKENAGPYTNYYPAAWYHPFDGGLAWITALGHDKKDYDDPVFVQHLFQGFQFLVSQLRPKDYTKTYSVSKDDAVRY